MPRIALTFCFAALLGSCTPSAQHTDWAQARRACADVGIAPDNSTFDQCVFNLYYALWDEQNEAER
jgi:hypothetical protein